MESELTYKIKRLKNFIMELNAVEQLEYCNRNWLSYGISPKKLSEEKLDLLRTILFEIEKVQELANDTSCSIVEDKPFYKNHE